MVQVIRFIVMLLSVTLTACGGGGGGGGGGASPDTAPPVLSGLAASSVTATDSVATDSVISWTTDEAATAQVEFGPTASYGSVSALDTTLTTSHSQTLPGLCPSTTMHYRVISQDAAGNTATSGDQTFVTADTPGAATRQTVVYSRLVRNATGGIAFVGLSLVKEDGCAPVTLTDAPNGGRVLESGDRIIFEREINGQSDVLSIKVDGTELVALADTPDSEGFNFVTPNGRVIFGRDAGGTQGDIFSINADGTGLTPLAASPDNESAVLLTPTGQVIFQRRTGFGPSDLFLINADGTGLTTLADSPDREHSPRLTPGGRIVFHRDIDVVGSTLNNTDLYSINADGTGLVPLATSQDGEFFTAVTENNRVIFERTPTASIPNATRPRDLFSINADGTGLITLANSSAIEAFNGLTPSGQVVFTRGPEGSRDLFLINANGTGLTTLANASEDETAVSVAKAVAATGRVLVHRIATNGLTDLLSVKTDGTGLVTLADSPDDEEFRHLTQSGRVIFTRDDARATDKGDVFSINVDGTGGTITLADSPDSESPVALTANERVIVFRGRFDSGVAQSSLSSIKSDGTDVRPLATEISGERLFFVTVF